MSTNKPKVNGSSTLNGSTSINKSNNRKLIVVANRLPVSITSDSNEPGGYRFTPSSGGLASALAGAKKKMDFTVS